MNLRIALLALTILFTTSAQTPQTNTPPQDANLANYPVNVTDAEKRISEKSLIFVGKRSLEAGQTTSEQIAELSTRGTSAKTGIQDHEEEDRQAFRIYRFVLKPNEKLKINLTSADDSRISMKFIRRVNTDPLTRQIRSANFPPEQIRRKQIQIENPYTEPNECLLYLLGRHNFAYTMEIERLRLK